jgi:hypothetical protein
MRIFGQDRTLVYGQLQVVRAESGYTIVEIVGEPGAVEAGASRSRPESVLVERRWIN